MRKALSVFLALLLCLGLGITAFAVGDTFVYDDADLLTADEEYELEQSLAGISRQTEAQIVVVTIDSADGWDLNSYANALYDQMDFGYGDGRSGVMLLVCMSIREYQIVSNGMAGYAIGSNAIDRIGDAIVPDLSDGDYADAFYEFGQQCELALRGYSGEVRTSPTDGLGVCLLIGLFCGCLVALILKSQLKSVRRASQAHIYTKHGSMNLTSHSDIFLYSNVSRVRIESNSSRSGRGGGGGRRSSGGGSF